MNSKKAITLLVLVTMLMALVPLVPVNAITLDPIAVTSWKGEKVTIVGGGVTAGSAVEVYWDLVQPWASGAGKLASGTAKADGTYEIKITVPEAVNGTHYIWVKDVSNGQTAGGLGYAIDITQYIEVTPSSGLVGDTVTVNGYGYGYDADAVPVIEIFADFSGAPVKMTTTPTTVKTNTVGSWTATFKVPTPVVPDPATYNVEATEKDWPANTDTETFDFGPVITLDKVEGPHGTVVTITGRGYDFSMPITVDIGGHPCYIVSGGTTRSDGKLTTKIVIPGMALVDDEPTEYPITVTVNAKTATADFEVNGAAKVKTTPTYGPQGTQIAVEGWNYTKISGTKITVKLGGLGSKTYDTDSDGHFKGLFTIPAVTSGTWVLTAEAPVDHDIYDEADVRVGVMMLILTPTSGATGTEVSITAIGLAADADYTVMIGDTEWFTGAANPDGSVNAVAMIPTLPVGVYDVSITEDESEIMVQTDFEITHTTMLKVTPLMAPNNYTITIEGWYFSPHVGPVSFWISNSTQEWSLGSLVGLGDDADWDEGYFKCTYDLPAGDVMSLGSYTLRAEDHDDLFAETMFDLVEKTQEITPRKSTFLIGDTVSFNIETSFVLGDSYIKIYAPTGELYWSTDKFEASTWVSVDTVNRVPYYYQTAGYSPMVLLTDAPQGVYTWKYYYEGDVVDEGTFTVDPAAADVVGEQVADLANQISDLQQSLSDVTSEFDDVKSDIASVQAIAQQAATAAQQAATAVQTVAQTANQANTAAQNAADAANAAKDAANGLTTLVYGAIGAALVAALAAIVSLMQISRRIAG